MIVITKNFIDISLEQEVTKLQNYLEVAWLPGSPPSLARDFYIHGKKTEIYI